MNSLLQHWNLPWRLPATTWRKRMNLVSHYRNVLYLDDSLQLLKEQNIELTSPTQKLTFTTPCNYSEKENELTVPTQKHTVPWWLPATTERLTHAPTQRNLPCRFPATTWRKRINSEPNYRNLLYLDDSLQLLKEKFNSLLQHRNLPWWLSATTQRKRMNSVPHYKKLLYLDDSLRSLKEKKLNSLLQYRNLPWQLPATTRRKNNELSAPTQKCIILPRTLMSPCNYLNKENKLIAQIEKCTLATSWIYWE